MLVPPVTFTVVALDHNNSAVPPIEIITEPETDRIAHAEREKRTGIIPVAAPGQIDDLRVVIRHIDDIWLARHDTDRIGFGHDLLLRGIDQSAGGARGGAQTLHGFHHFRGLIKEDFAKLFGPRQILIHPFYDVRIMSEGFYRIVPGLILQARRPFAVRQITGRENDIGGLRGRRKNQRNQGVRIKGDGPEKLIELLGSEMHCRRFHRARKRSIFARGRHGGGIRSLRPKHLGEKPDTANRDERQRREKPKVHGGVGL